MTSLFKKEITSQIATVFFILLTVWWIYLRLTTSPDDLHNQLFAATYGIMALWGFAIGFFISTKWGGAKSLLGKSLMLFSLGLLAQEFGQLAYSFYIYSLNIEVPYPSVGDIGYFGSIFLYAFGAYYLARVSGVKISFTKVHSLILAVVVPLVFLAVSYFLFLQGYDFSDADPLTIFLDFGYPLGQAIYVSIAIVAYILSRNILGGIMRTKILMIIIALIMQYFADFIFLYQANRETWYAGGTNDYIYLTSYFLMTLALIRFKTVSDELTGKSK